MRILLGLSVSLFWLCGLQAQEVNPRQWGHLPVGATFVAGGAVWTEAEVFLDPVLRAEDVEVTGQTFLAGATHAFSLWGQTARMDVTALWGEETWEGLLNGEEARRDLSGWRDLAFRFSWNWLGSPALEGEDYRNYRRQAFVSSTVAGVGVKVLAPVGEYDADRLLNLGGNRWSIRPQVGITHSRGRWAVEGTGAVWFWTDNPDFFGGSTREQDPLLALQGHLVYTVRPGMWVAGSLAWGEGAESRVDGVAKDDRSENLLASLRFGIPLDDRTGFTFGWVRTETRTGRGQDSHSFLLTLSHRL